MENLTNYVRYEDSPEDHLLAPSTGFRPDAPYTLHPEEPHPFKDILFDSAEFWRTMYEYWGQGGYDLIFLASVLNIMSVQFFFGFIFSFLYLVRGDLHYILYLTFIAIHLGYIIVWLIPKLRLARRYKEYLSYYNIDTTKNWSDFVPYILDNSFRNGWTLDQVNRILYEPTDLYKRLFTYGVLHRFWSRTMAWELKSSYIFPMMEKMPNIQKVMVRQGIFFLAISPIILVFQLGYAFLRYGILIRYNRSYVRLKEWSPLAKLIYNRDNEPYWESNRRLEELSYTVEKYQLDNTSRSQIIVLRSLSFALGAPLAILIAYSLFAAEVTSNMVLLMGVVGSLVTLLQNSIPRRDRPVDLSKLEDELVGIDMTRIRYLYSYKLLIFAQEMVSVIVTPLMLIFYLPKRLHLLEEVPSINV